MVRSFKTVVRRLLSSPAAAALRLAAFVTEKQLVSLSGAQSAFADRGFHLLRHSYYLPIPEASDVAGDFWESRSELVGLSVNVEEALRLVEEDLAPYIAEMRSQFPMRATPGSTAFHLLNGTFMAGDAQVYYGMIRHLKPRRVIEIGAGWSTVLASSAVLRNRAEGVPTELSAIEPFPSEELIKGLPGLARLIRSRVQSVPLEEFMSLEGGDILFIDSSHVLRAGGDVQYEFLEILPRLRAGVYVHVHDISLPKQYPRTYYERGLFWNEQYLLQAFLAFNSKYRILWPGNYVMLSSPERLMRAIPEIADMRRVYPFSEPASFWMRSC